MTTYRVIVTPEAESGIVEAFSYLLERSPDHAAKWLRGFYGVIETLESMPERCALSRENEYFDGPFRQLVFKSHRIIFRVEDAGKIVRVLHVTHGKQRTTGEPDDED